MTVMCVPCVCYLAAAGGGGSGNGDESSYGLLDVNKLMAGKACSIMFQCFGLRYL